MQTFYKTGNQYFGNLPAAMEYVERKMYNIFKDFKSKEPQGRWKRSKNGISYVVKYKGNCYDKNLIRYSHMLIRFIEVEDVNQGWRDIV